MGYWNDERGYNFTTKEEAAAYFAGLEAGVRAFAIWKDGEQRVGCLQKPLGEILAEIRSDYVEALGRL